jgi:hypothetical protein
MFNLPTLVCNGKEKELERTRFLNDYDLINTQMSNIYYNNIANLFNSKAKEVLSSSNIWSFIPSILRPFLKFHHQHLPLSLPSPKYHQ